MSLKFAMTELTTTVTAKQTAPTAIAAKTLFAQEAVVSRKSVTMALIMTTMARLTVKTGKTAEKIQLANNIC